MFSDTLKVQGLHYDTYLVKLQDPDEGRVFLVKNWDFFGPPTGADPEYPYRLVADYPSYYDFYPGEIPDFAMRWKAPWEIIDEGGVKGQGNDNPESLFGYHKIVAVGESGQSYNDEWKHYDPSYGKEYASVEHFGEAIAGYGYGVAPGEGFYFRPNSNSLLEELEWTTEQY